MYVTVFYMIFVVDAMIVVSHDLVALVCLSLHFRRHPDYIGSCVHFDAHIDTLRLAIHNKNL